ncbi:L,D-transpeptidase family protein [Flavobacterium sp. W22_SRS_FK3]|uniref:L,D-transpeptidase family protein n=1 Tax=Flavobacterium sp. W22_SRS_FK3 TaxID=3240275 RepID=UPI003F8E357F
MRHFNNTLLIIAIGFLFSSFCLEKKSKINDKLNLKENTSSTKFIDSISFAFSNSTIKTYQNIVSDSIKNETKPLKKDAYVLSTQYDKLEAVLKKYQKIQKKKLWKNIDIDSATYKDLKPFDSGSVVKQIRERLFVVGDLKQDSKSGLYDEEMMAGVLNYKKRYGLTLNYKLTFDHIKQMNEPIANRIETIKLNMERCQLIPENLVNASDYIMVNIPAFRMIYVKDGVNELTSDVFVGKTWSETEIFSSSMDRVVFSPYWNIPQSIIDNELKLNMASDKNYLEDHNMEWNGGRVRQKPGPKNSLGLVKFLFPNPYDIYMHDTPAKSLFMFEQRTFSHGCINIKEAKKLAHVILKDDPEWPSEKIDSAMSGESEITCMLKNKIPVYLGYFTAWVNEETGEISFFSDVYGKDKEMEDSKTVVMD